MFYLWPITLSECPFYCHLGVTLYIFHCYLLDISGVLGIFIYSLSRHNFYLWIELCYELTHLTLVPHICICELAQHWMRWWLVTYLVPSHYMKSWTDIDLLSIGPLATNFSEIWIRIKKFFINENTFENSVCKKAAILFRGRLVNSLAPGRF